MWPSHRQQTFAVALLFLVYPGYSQHWVAFTHINQEWIPFIAYLVSFGLSVRAIRRPKAFLVLTACALLLEAVGLFPTEYFIGLEPLRLLFFWVMAAQVTQGFAARTIKALKAWWPYFAVWLADVIWLVHYYRSGAYVSYDLTATTAPPAFTAAVSIFGDALWKAGVYVWGQVLVLLSASIQAPASLLTVALIAAAFLLAAFYLSRLEFRPTRAYRVSVSSFPMRQRSRCAGPIRAQFAWAAVIIGIAGIVLGRLPSFAAGLPLTLQSSFDRFMISMMLGGSLFAVGLVELILRSRSARIFTIAGLLALGIGQQFFNCKHLPPRLATANGDLLAVCLAHSGAAAWHRGDHDPDAPGLRDRPVDDRRPELDVRLESAAASVALCDGVCGETTGRHRSA